MTLYSHSHGFSVIYHDHLGATSRLVSSKHPTCSSDTDLNEHVFSAYILAVVVVVVVVVVVMVVVVVVLHGAVVEDVNSSISNTSRVSIA